MIAGPASASLLLAPDVHAVSGRGRGATEGERTARSQNFLPIGELDQLASRCTDTRRRVALAGEEP